VQRPRQLGDRGCQAALLARERVGRDVELAVDGHYVKYRMFFVGSRFYQLIISTNSEFAADTSVQKSMNRFMDSFQLIEKNQGSM